MPNHVFVVSEWLAKENHEQELQEQFKNLLKLSLETEKGCISARVTHQVEHSGSPTKSKYTLVLLQEYEDIKAFDIHCKAEYVINFFKEFIENKETAIVKDWQCRLFSE